VVDGHPDKSRINQASSLPVPRPAIDATREKQISFRKLFSIA
jgi:hypothetical protein